MNQQNKNTGVYVMRRISHNDIATILQMWQYQNDILFISLDSNGNGTYNVYKCMGAITSSSTIGVKDKKTFELLTEAIKHFEKLITEWVDEIKENNKRG